MKQKQIEQQLIQILEKKDLIHKGEIQKIDSSQLLSDFLNQYYIDSVDRVLALMEIEKVFNISLEDYDIMQCQTIQDFISLVERQF